MKKLKRKKGNSIGEFLCAFFIMIPIAATLVSQIQSTKASVDIGKIEQVANEYLLRMESKGCLNSQDQLEFTNDLTQIGVDGVNITGTTFSKVAYGSDVHLYIKGTYKLKMLNIDINNTQSKEEIIPVDIHRKSTAKN